VPTRPAQARAAADSPYGVYSEHIATIAAVAPPPPRPAATARLLETGTKLHISNLDSGVTVEDVQVLPMLLLLGNSLSNLAIASVLLCYLKDIGSLFL
jgi:THO complex subunit 4